MPGAGIGGVSASPAAPFEFEPPVDCWAGPAEPGIELDGTPPDPVFPVLSAPPPGDPTPLPMPEPAAPPAPPVPPALPAEPPLLEPPPPPPPAWAKAIGAAVTDKAVTSAKVCNRWEIMNSSGARRRRSASDNLTPIGIRQPSDGACGFSLAYGLGRIIPTLPLSMRVVSTVPPMALRAQAARAPRSSGNRLRPHCGIVCKREESERLDLARSGSEPNVRNLAKSRHFARI
jgi:hypothetical protein